MRYFIYLLGGLIASTALAAPKPKSNTWQLATHAPFADFVIYNDNGQRLTLTCNQSAPISNEHRLALSNGDTLTDLMGNDGVYQLHLNNQILTIPHSSQNHKDAIAWEEITTQLSYAPDISVWRNNEPLANFRPTPKSRQKIASKIILCEPLLFG